MSTDYIVLAVIAFIAIGGGLLLLSQAKSYRARHQGGDKHHNSAKHA
jgi:hypothetical protein